MVRSTRYVQAGRHKPLQGARRGPADDHTRRCACGPLSCLDHHHAHGDPMISKRSLLTLAISCWLAAPALAQEAAPAPEAAPAQADPSMPSDPTAVPAP